MQSVVREAHQSTKGPEQPSSANIQAVIIMTHFGTPLLHHKAADGSCPEYDLPALGRCLASLQHLMEGEDDVCEHMVALLHMGPLQFLVLGPYRAWRLSVAILVQHVSPTVTMKGLQLLHTFTNLFEPIINNLVRKDFDQSARRLAGTAQDMLQQRASSSSGSCSEDDTSRLFEAFEDQYVLPLLSCSPADYARHLLGPWLRCEQRPRHGLALLDVQGGELIYYCHASVHDDEAELHPQPHWWAGDRRRAIRQAAAKCFPAREGGHAALRRRDGQEVQGVVLRWASVVRHGPNHALLHRTHMPSFVLVLPYTQRVPPPAAPHPSSEPPPAAVSLLPLSVAPPALLSLLEPLVCSLANAFLPRPTLAAYAHTGRMPAAVGANELVCQQDRAAAWSASLSPFSPTALPLLSMDSQGGDEDDDNKEGAASATSSSSSKAGKVGGGLVFAPLLQRSMREDLERLLDMDENDLLLTTTTGRLAAAGPGGCREEEDGAVTHRAVEAAEPAAADPSAAAQEQEQPGGGGGGGSGHVRVKARAGLRHSLDHWLLVPAARAVAGLVAAAGARPSEQTRRKVP